MTRNLYGLLVGINEYDERSHIPPLKGCLNDIRAMQAYLQGRIDKENVELHLRLLTNQQATRQGVIDGFRQHLAQAGQDDIALFYYAGYGVKAAAPEAFWPADTDRMMETLVCYDSRSDHQHWDLADKELARLIAEVDKNGAHTVVVLDCGYSGTASGANESPSVAIRSITPDLRQRPVNSFIVSPDEAEALSLAPPLAPKNQRSYSQGALQSAAAMRLPMGRHRVLSACSAIEQAQEYYGSGEAQGAFSHFLQESLAKARGSLSYRDLFKQTNALMRSSLPAQSPQMAATHEIDLQGPFLGGAIAPSPAHFTVSHHPVDGWIIDGGKVHGLASPQGTETTALALFPFHSPRSQMTQIEEAIAQATVTQVNAQFSKIQSANLADANPTDLFKAVVTKLPLPAISVFVEGEKAGTEALRRAVAVAGPNAQPSSYVQATDQINGARLRVYAADGVYAITTPANGGKTAEDANRLLANTILGYDAADEVVKALEHIARWQAIAHFTSPATSQIQGSVELKIYTGATATPEAATEITAAQIRLAYQNNQTGQTQTPPRFRIKLHNQSNQPLYCALFYLTERFKSAAIKPDSVGSVVRLMPNQETWFAGGAALNGRVPDDIWQQGITECQDILKLVACTAAFDPTLMNLGELGKATHEAGGPMRSATGDSSLTRLMQRVNSRHASSTGELPTYDDWITNQVAFTFIRPQLSTPISRTSAVDIGAANEATARVIVQPHPQLAARARLITPAQAASGADSVLPALLQTETVPFQFTPSRASAPGLSGLELSGISQPEAVTPAQPLCLETDMPLGEDQYIFPVAHDGEFYIPLGYGKTQNGKTQIVIERLPLPASQAANGQPETLPIFFQKIAASQGGHTLSSHMLSPAVDVEYPVLRAAQIDTGSSQIVYARDQDIIRANIAKAKTIAIYIHGLFSDTAAILSDIATATAQPQNAPSYDLILTFDYDSLNTPLEQNARSLKRQLESVGLGAKHSQKLHIIAHSIGGLLARWFVEKEAGYQVIDHLIMLGVPNAGASWQQVHAGTTAAIAHSLNGLSQNASALKALGGWLKRIKTPDTSRDQMQPGSEFLNALAGPATATSANSNIPYTLVMGNTLLIPADDKAALRQRLMSKLGAIAELSFFNQPNDMAVLASSIIAVPQSHKPTPKLLPVACNHLEYFSHPAGITALNTAIAEALAKPAKVSKAASPIAVSGVAVSGAVVAGISTAQSANSQNIATPKVPVNAPPARIPPNESALPKKSERQASQTQASQPQASQPSPLPPIPVQNPLPQNPRTVQPHMKSPGQPPQPPSDQPPNQPPPPVYAPEREPSPEASTSPLMWGWLLFTGVLALIVAIAWIQYLGESDEDTTPVPVSPAPTEPALPSVPEAPPAEPETEADADT